MKVAIIGCGVMGSALAHQFAKNGHEVALCDRDQEKLRHLSEETGGRACANPDQATEDAGLIVLAVKPEHLHEIGQELAPKQDQLLLSILAGTTLKMLKSRFAPARVIRAMPNLALKVGEAVIALVGDEELQEEEKKAIVQLFEPMGVVFWTEESKINAITALTGSGPAFVLAMIEAMIDGGIAMGLKAQEALGMTLQTFKGAIALVQKNGGNPEEIRWNISAPKGTTIAGIRALEEHGVRSGIIETLLAAYQKAEEMQ